MPQEHSQWKESRTRKRKSLTRAHLSIQHKFNFNIFGESREFKIKLQPWLGSGKGVIF